MRNLREKIDEIISDEFLLTKINELIYLVNSKMETLSILETKDMKNMTYIIDRLIKLKSRVLDGNKIIDFNCVVNKKLETE